MPATVASGGQLALPKSPIPGYGVEVLEWEARATPGGPVVRVKGTVEDVVAELAKTNPDIRENIIAAAANKQVMDTKYEQESYQCFGRWKPAPRDVIKQGIDYLRGVNGQPSLGPGLGNCTRVSCSYDAAIWWCNDVSCIIRFLRFRIGAVANRSSSFFFSRTERQLEDTQLVRRHRQWCFVH